MIGIERGTIGSVGLIGLLVGIGDKVVLTGVLDIGAFDDPLVERIGFGNRMDYSFGSVVNTFCKTDNFG